MIASHVHALIHEEDKVSVAKPVRLSQLLESQVEGITRCQDNFSEQIYALKANPGVVGFSTVVYTV